MILASERELKIGQVVSSYEGERGEYHDDAVIIVAESTKDEWSKHGGRLHPWYHPSSLLRFYEVDL